MGAADLADALGLRRCGAQWRGPCPVHGGTGEAFSVMDGDSGRPVVYCFAGCDFRSIVAELKARGLWEDDRPVSREDALVRRQERELKRARRIVKRFDELQRCDTFIGDSDYREWDWARAILWMHGEDEHPYCKQIREALGDA